jgi:hypothetical protein
MLNMAKLFCNNCGSIAVALKKNDIFMDLFMKETRPIISVKQDRNNLQDGLGSRSFGRLSLFRSFIYEMIYSHSGQI